MDERARRIGENEALYRAINERIESLSDSLGVVDESMGIICECGMVTCTAQIQLDLPTYRRVREEPTHFFVLPGHEIEDVEDVVERGDRYNVVRKKSGGPAELARETA